MVDGQEIFGFYSGANDSNDKTVRSIVKPTMTTPSTMQSEEWLKKGREILKCAEEMNFTSERFSVEHEASLWLKKAAEHGHPIAQFELHLSYDMARGVEEDARASLFWLETSALHGYVLAQTDLGFLSWQEKNYAKAKYWYEMAANQNDFVSHVRLGEMFENGYDCEINYESAYRFYRQGIRL